MDFAIGVGEGVGRTAVDSAKATDDALTTNPITTARAIGRGIAGTIDGALAAEDTPARVQVARAVAAVRSATPRQLGRGVGAVAANTALAAAPGAAAAKISAVRHARTLRPREVFHPPQIEWRRERRRAKKPDNERWINYQDPAIGARPDHAPALLRKMPDGSTRPVKFDGVDGDYPIDRKLSLTTHPRSIAQLKRQSDVLAQHRLIAVYELPTIEVRDAARKILKKQGIKNSG